MSGQAGIVSLAAAVPGHAYERAQLADWLCEYFGYPQRLARLVRRLHARSAIAKRHSVLADFEPGRRPRLFRDPRTCDIEARMAVFADEAPRLAAQACGEALTEAGLAAAEVTHLVLVTSTSFMTPGPGVHVAHGFRNGVVPPHLDSMRLGSTLANPRRGGISAIMACRGMATRDARAVRPSGSDRTRSAIGYRTPGPASSHAIGN